MGNANACIISRKNKMWKFIKNILIGVAGSVLLIVFFTGLMSFDGILKLLPWVIGFNAALTGYNLIKENGDIRSICAVWAGTAMVIISMVILNFIFFYIMGGFLILISDLIFLIPGCSFLSWLGAMLAIKYRNN